MNFKRTKVPGADRPPAQPHPAVSAVSAKLQRPLTALEVEQAKTYGVQRFGKPE